MQLNRLYFDEKDPTKMYCSFIILDFEVSGNGVIVSEDVALDGSKSLKNMPIVTKFNGDDFGSHEFVEEVVDGKKKIKRDTIPIGVFSTEGYIEEIEINGEMKRVLMADGLLWYSRFIDACDLLHKWIEEGTKVNMSCEYLYKNISIIDDIEYHLKPIYFDGHCILSTKVKPAYDSATIIDTSEFNMLVAQAINQEKDKEDNILVEETKDENLETNEEIEQEKNIDTQEVHNTDAQINEEETKTQLNELSHDDVRSQIRDQVKAHIQGEEWLWVVDVFVSYAIVHVEYEDEWKYYKYNYTISGETVIIDTESQAEVKEKREWVAITNELQVELDTVKSEKDALATKFNSATETIISLNSTIDQLKPFQEQMLNAQRESRLTTQTETYETKFNAVNAMDAFKSEEVQTLIMNSIEDNDEGKNALLKLNEILFDSIKVEKVKIQTNAIAGIASKREFNNVVENDDFNSKYKY
ncbi:hypothetical protein ACQKNX_08165 [Lysinibacillus sp. NPDC093712]|uniref:hypothetical protein n=1 Tax=Lysinibacillus sp. NPDC093712 TaxID=3390579 RepID=UPI003CFCF62A